MDLGHRYSGMSSGTTEEQPDCAKRGRTIHTADALIAGTTRSHGAVLLTHNLGDFPMHDIRVEPPEVDDV